MGKCQKHMKTSHTRELSITLILERTHLSLTSTYKTHRENERRETMS